MNNAFSDNEIDSLMNSGELGIPPLTPEPAPVDVPVTKAQDLRFFGKIPVNVTLEVASTEIPLKDLMEVDTSSVIVLDKLAGEALDVKVNGALFAKAEVVVMNGNYGLRILELTGTGLNGLAS